MLGIIRGFEGAKRRKEKEKQHLISFLVKCQSTEIQIVPSTLKLLDKGERKKQQERHRQTEESSSRVAAGDVKLLHLQKKKKKNMWDQGKRIKTGLHPSMPNAMVVCQKEKKRYRMVSFYSETHCR